jgi:hypothetical protein
MEVDAGRRCSKIQFIFETVDSIALITFADRPVRAHFCTIGRHIEHDRIIKYRNPTIYLPFAIASVESIDVPAEDQQIDRITGGRCPT